MYFKKEILITNNECYNFMNESYLNSKKLYLFRSFKKNIKFKRFNRGLTRFIKNRKKFMLRRKRNSLLSHGYIVHFWTKSYSKYRQFARFYQSYNSFRFTLNSPSALYSQSVIQNITLTTPNTLYMNSLGISKRLLYNNSEIRITGKLWNDKILSAGNLNFIMFSTTDNLLKTFDVGSIFSDSHFYTTTLLSNNNSVIQYKNLSNIFLNKVLTLVKALNKILMVITLKNIIN